MQEFESLAKQISKDYPNVKKVALSYSGGLDSAVVGKLVELAGMTVLPVVVDVGQRSDFRRIEENAKKMFKQCLVVDAKQEVAEAVMRAVKSNFGHDRKANGGGIVRPALAHALVQAARKHGCQAIAHGSSGMGNDSLCMENSLRVLAPELRIMALVRDLDLRRDQSLEFAAKSKLLTNLERAEKFSADESLWGRTVRQGKLVEEKEAPKDAYKWTASPEEAPDSSEEIELAFHSGEASFAKIGGEKLKEKVAIIQKLNEVGGKHGIGRMDVMDDKVVGLKVREVYECPAASILLFAHQKLEELTLTRQELLAKQSMDALWSRLVHAGLWHSRLRRAIDAFVDETQKAVQGRLVIRLYKGNIILKERESINALYDRRLSGRDSKGVFSQKEARQFSKLYALQEIVAYLVESEAE
ncbi:MAG: argininosuccinate synthase [Candidatus Micrarchaeota archaeon]|nr:argininosuccinate synthase [Candidatus Micrarchaeota archaeon]